MEDEQHPPADKWPLTRLFDVVQSEYGWTDNEVLSLTLGRLKTASEVIMERRNSEFKGQIKLMQEHARGIIGAMPGLAFSGKAGKSIQKAARAFRLLPKEEDEPRQLPETETVERLFSGRRR